MSVKTPKEKEKKRKGKKRKGNKKKKEKKLSGWWVEGIKHPIFLKRCQEREKRLEKTYKETEFDVSVTPLVIEVKFRSTQFKLREHKSENFIVELESRH